MKWKTAEGLPSYSVSDTGLVKRIAGGQGSGLGKTVKPFADDRGYLYVVLCEQGKPIRRAVHRLVALAFIENPKHLPEVNHKKRPKSNCRVSNLEWRSKKGNRDHAVRRGFGVGDGVHFNKNTKKWAARYSPTGARNTYLGEYLTKREAIKVRNTAVKNMKEVL